MIAYVKHNQLFKDDLWVLLKISFKIKYRIFYILFKSSIFRRALISIESIISRYL